jgi:putative two-component system response regulator
MRTIEAVDCSFSRHSPGLEWPEKELHVKEYGFVDASDQAGGSAGRIFVVDDDPEIRRLLRALLAAAGYEVEEFGSGVPALERLHSNPPDLVLLDLQLPDLSGHRILEEIRLDPATRLLPVIMLTGHATLEEKLRATREGVTDFLAKPVAIEELLPRVRSLVQMKHFADEHEHVERVLLTLATLIDTRDPFTAGHGGRVAEYADRIGQRLGMDPEARSHMRRGALFLDIGKIVIPDAVLHKTAALTPEERASIEEHSRVGYELLAPLKTMSRMLPILRSHHEKLDGSGYPDRLSGDQISLPVRIATVSDVFDALTTDRAYRVALKAPTAFEILQEGVAKAWWDPNVVRELSAAVDEMGVLGGG